MKGSKTKKSPIPQGRYGATKDHTFDLIMERFDKQDDVLEKLVGTLNLHVEDDQKVAASVTHHLDQHNFAWKVIKGMAVGSVPVSAGLWALYTYFKS